MKKNQIDLRVHHFFDVIRAFGKHSDANIEPHPHGHSFHSVVELIRTRPSLEIKLVIECDSVCCGCCHCKNGLCNDNVDHRKDFISKEEFNNFVDKRAMKKCLIKIGEVLTPSQLCQKAGMYLDNIDFIYAGNDDWHTAQRKKDVIKGLKYYSRLHDIKIIKAQD